MTTRREFLTRTLKSAAALAVSGGALGLDGLLRTQAVAGEPEDRILSILHTNDVHSRFEPFEGGRNDGMAGAARRGTLVRRIREQAALAGQPRPLLLDAGDLFQGTPYFNLFHGKADFEIVKALEYDAMTIGNHDFDIGMDGLVSALDAAKMDESFNLLSANYDVSDTILAPRVKAFTILQRSDVRIGIFGMGVILKGLVASKLCKGVLYSNPIPVAQQTSRHLRHEEKCDLVICLSHLGLHGSGGEPGDTDIAAACGDIDLVVGGHSHSFMREPERFQHQDRETLVFQVGFGGIYLGRVDFHLRGNGVVVAHAAALPVEALSPSENRG
jgi:5'-nucleotidase